MATATIPVLVETEEARHRMAKLNMQGELEIIADWLRTTLPDLYGIRVRHGSSHSPVAANLLVVWADRYCDESNPVTDLIEWDFVGWAFYALPFEICRNIILCCTFRPFPA